MKTATVTLTKNARTFQLAMCRVEAWVDRAALSARVTLNETLALGSSPAALAEQGRAAGLMIVNPPTPGTLFFMKGTRQPDGSVLDPVADWNGRIVEQRTR
jgi:hypothetical protein